MVAVPDVRSALPTDGPAVDRPVAEPTVHATRIVAVALSSAELLRPGSDLVRAIAGAGHVDVLLACRDDRPPAGADDVGSDEADDTDGEIDDDVDDDLDDDVDEGGDADDPAGDELRAAVARLGLEEVHVHRLGLRAPLDVTAHADLVAALSELVGFDPEPGVRCLAPALLPGDASRIVVDGAAQYIAQVYALPLLHYGALTLVDPDPAARN